MIDSIVGYLVLIKTLTECGNETNYRDVIPSSRFFFLFTLSVRGISPIQIALITIPPLHIHSYRFHYELQMITNIFCGRILSRKMTLRHE